MDCLSHVCNVFESLKVPKSINSTIITPISKIENTNRVNHFRPISLVNSSYKMITKILVSGIRHHLHDIISPNQNRFILSRGFEVNFI